MKKFLLLFLLFIFCSNDDFQLGAEGAYPWEEEYALNWFEENRVSYPELTNEEMALSENSRDFYPSFTFKYDNKFVTCERRLKGMNILALSNEPHPVTRNVVVNSSYSCSEVLTNSGGFPMLFGGIWYQYGQWWGLAVYEQADNYDELQSLMKEENPDQIKFESYLSLYAHRIPLVGIDN